MKTWHTRWEWMGLANCWGSAAHTAENPTDDQLAHAAALCGECVVRPECLQEALRTKANSVVVAGVYLPDPIHKEELKLMYQQLKDSLPRELEARGEI